MSTYVTDVKHYLTEEAATAPKSGPAKRFAKNLQAFGFGAAAHAADKMVRERGYLGAPDHFRALTA